MEPSLPPTVKSFMDLEPSKDPKGGSPRTPTAGIPVREYQEYVAPITVTGNHVGVWRMIAAGGWGLVGGLFLAWLTALQSKGVTQEKMQEYDKEYSLYAQQKEGINQRNQTQDEKLGILQGLQQANIAKLSTHDGKLHDEDRDIIELQNKVKQFGDFVDELRKAKK